MLLNYAILNDLPTLGFYENKSITKTFVHLNLYDISTNTNWLVIEYCIKSNFFFGFITGEINKFTYFYLDDLKKNNNIEIIYYDKNNKPSIDTLLKKYNY